MNVFLNATAFPLCNAVESLWNRNGVSRRSFVASVVLFLARWQIRSLVGSMHLPSRLQSEWSDASCLIPCILLSCLQLLGQQQPLLLLLYHRCRSGRRYLGWWYPTLGFASRPWNKGSTIGSFAGRSWQASWLLHCWILRLFPARQTRFVHLGVAYLTRCTLPAGHTMQALGVYHQAL